MRIKHRYSFRVDEATKEIVDFLKHSNIKYKISFGIPILTLDIYENSNNWENLYKLMCKYDKHSISECVYSKKEMDTAEWLRIRSKWRSEYPQPEEEYEKITYDGSMYCSSCGCGLVQKNSFRLKKTPKWGKKNFLMLNWVESELFINNKVANLIQKEDVKGYDVTPVMNNNTNESLDNIKQLKIRKALKSGIVFEDVDVIKVNKCSQCYSEKLLLSGRSPLVFKKDIFTESVDIIKTNEFFGDGLVCLQMIFISKKLYKLFCKHGWEKDLKIEPLTLT